MGKNKNCSLDEELMMCAAYRYAIGRHTYISTLANYIAKEYYNRLSNERLAFTAKDIRETINNCMSYGPIEIHYEGSVSYDERDAFGDLMEWMKDNVTSVENLDGIERLEVYKTSYSKEAPKLFRVYKCEPKIERYKSQMDIDDLICWYTLYLVFDKTKHKILHLKNGTTVKAVKSWTKKTVECENNPKFLHQVSWQWVHCWKPVDNFVNGESNTYIPDEYIESIE